jgi:hypothetical protein
MSQPVQEVWDPDEWMSGAAKTRSARFGATQAGQSPVPGSVEGGVVLSKKMVQQTVYKPSDPTVHGKLKFYENSGKPMLQMIVRVQTDRRDDEEDDGIRAIFVKGQMKYALQDALGRAGAPNVEIGGLLKVKFVEQVFEEGLKKNVFACWFQRPTAVEADDWMTAPVASQPAPAPQSQPQPAAANQSTLDKIRAGTAEHQRSLRNDYDEPPF